MGRWEKAGLALPVPPARRSRSRKDPDAMIGNCLRRAARARFGRSGDRGGCLINRGVCFHGRALREFSVGRPRKASQHPRALRGGAERKRHPPARKPFPGRLLETAKAGEPRAWINQSNEGARGKRDPGGYADQRERPARNSHFRLYVPQPHGSEFSSCRAPRGGLVRGQSSPPGLVVGPGVPRARCSPAAAFVPGVKHG